MGDKIQIGKSYEVVSNWSKKFAGQSAVFRVSGRKTRVEDIHAKQIHLGRASRCGKVYAEVVHFEEGCIVEEINYTREVRGPIEMVDINHSFPKKVEKLPDLPV